MMKQSLMCVAGLLFMIQSAFASEIGYYRQPAINGNRLVFVSEGDLWTATIPDLGNNSDSPIIAYRLTSSDGSESHPVISPDGQTVAFAGQYDGNTDVYLMPIDGGAPKRLTFHGGADYPVAWRPGGAELLFRSSRAHPLGNYELWRISPAGGMPMRYGFGECSMASVSETGTRLAFTRWSNENWTWKRYRGGTAPEIWIGDLNADQFFKLTDNPANDLFPMWTMGRVYFLSDRAGTANIFSDSSRGGDLKQHTQFAANPQDPTALGGYDVRWPRSDSARRGKQIVFCQAGALAVLDLTNDKVRRLDVRLASDRTARRQRFAKPMETMTGYALSADGTKLVIDSRGEILLASIGKGEPRQLTHLPGTREWGATFLDDETLTLVSDVNGEQQISFMNLKENDAVGTLTENRDDWLFPPVASPDGNWIIFADKTMRLHILNFNTLDQRMIDRAEGGEITDYRFSPDSKWVAYSKPMANGQSSVFIYAISTGRSFSVSAGLSDDREPRWDPAGKYLYFLSRRHLNPMLGEFDFEHVYLKSTKIYVVPLAADSPPPLVNAARAAGFDLEEWAREPKKESGIDFDQADEAEGIVLEAGDEEQIRIDAEGLSQRQYALPIEPGNYSSLEAQRGAVSYLDTPIKGLLDEDDFGTSSIEGDSTLHRYDLVNEKAKVLAEGVSNYTLSAQGNTIAYPVSGGFDVIPASGGEAKRVDLSSMKLRVDVAEEWKQIFNESWRLQRDFYWAPNMVGIDWPGMKEKYGTLLPRIGTRTELNDLIGQLIGELGTSHTYIWGGQTHDQADSVSVGALGADIEFDGRGFRIARILAGHLWDDSVASPLAAPHLGVKEGSYIMAINGLPLTSASNFHDLLQDQAGRMIRIDLADDDAGTNRRTIEVRARSSDRPVRYASWVENNRKYVEEASDGQLGYLHIPDMGGKGLVAFSRLFYPQVKKKGLVIDIRHNGGGFVSQMIINRLAKKPIAFDQPRHGATVRYPENALNAHLVTIIDQHAGSDGDIFPAAFKALNLGPLIGMRTWGGVVGIRGDKPFVDMGLSTQPEFAWWDEQGGWSIENHGVDPDIEIDITPEDRLVGRDPQLDRAIEYLLQKIQSEKREDPPVPAYPVRTGRDQ